jgi:hypothetical protein
MSEAIAALMVEARGWTSAAARTDPAFNRSRREGRGESFWKERDVALWDAALSVGKLAIDSAGSSVFVAMATL